MGRRTTDGPGLGGHAGKGAKHVTNLNPGEGEIADLHIVRPDGDPGNLAQTVGPQAHVEVLPDDSADIEKEIGALHGRSHGGRVGGLAAVDAEALRMGLIEETLVHIGQGKGQAGALEEGKKLRLGLVAPDMEGGEDHGTAGFFHPGHDGLDGGPEFRRAAFPAGDGGYPGSFDRGLPDRHPGKILGDEHVGGLAEAEGLADEAFQFGNDVIRSEMGEDTGRGGGDIEKIVIGAVTQGVMSHQAATLDPSGGGSDHMEDRDPVGFGAHHAVDGAEFTHGVGGGEEGGPAATGIAVGGVGGIEFVGADDPLHAGGKLDGVVDREGVVPGDTKGVFDAKIREAIDYVISNFDHRFPS